MNEKPLKPIITDSSSFERYRKEDAVYVDKTKPLHRLITNPSSRNYFISRPRRFGKSLMISTLEAIFKGRRELFKGLAIDTLEYDWEEYPVLRFDMSKAKAQTYEQFLVLFEGAVKKSIENAGIAYHSENPPAVNFDHAIGELVQKSKKPVVILIDEYDAPVGNCLGNVEIADKIREELSSFYIQIKANNADIRFMLMTGVSKFTQLSVFSALNNLTDITLDREAVDLLGYSDEDLEFSFGGHMREHAKRIGLSYEEYREGLRKWSDGYRFSPFSPMRMYNPFSIANTLNMMLPEFVSTWSTTGSPSFLTNFAHRESFLDRNFEDIKNVSSVIFDVSNLRALRPETLLYQAGYLTIKEGIGSLFSLGIPNEEIRQDINAMLLEIQAEGDRRMERDQIGGALKDGDFEEFETLVKAFYAGLPYGSREAKIRQSEFLYARIFNALLRSAGFELRPEDTQTCGRSDLVANGTKATYIFEFKVNKSASKAIEQILKKDYAAPYRGRGLPIFAFGLNFSSRTARLTDFAVKEI